MGNPPTRSKYKPLRDWLTATEGDTAMATFDEVATLVGSLPASAWKHQAWWANESSGSHSQALSWLTAGFRVESFDQSEGWVRFRRTDA